MVFLALLLMNMLYIHFLTFIMLKIQHKSFLTTYTKFFLKKLIISRLTCNAFLSSYYSKCDLINKYHLTNVQFIPEIKKVQLCVFFEEFLSVMNNKKILNYEDSQYLLYFSLFCLLGFRPKFVNMRLASKKFRRCLFVSSFKKREITYFIYLFFFENRYKIRNKDILQLLRKRIDFKSNTHLFLKIELSNVLSIFALNFYFFEKKFKATIFSAGIHVLFNSSFYWFLSKNIQSKCYVFSTRNIFPFWVF
jgi:hypothetical protein